MNAEYLVALGNQSREDNNPEQALSYYAAAFVNDRNNFSAWNNYGNVLRELGDPAGAIPFLQRAITLDPNNITAQFNLAVSYLLMGDYERGWPAYESRWQYEHLAGALPQLSQPRWIGQSLADKTILLIGEQGHGDTIQFVRFSQELHNLGAKIIIQVSDTLKSLIQESLNVSAVIGSSDPVPEFDYWAPMMSVPGVLNITLDRLPKSQYYLAVSNKRIQHWQQRLGPKQKLRVGLCWSGRRDTWMNRHKGMLFDLAKTFVENHPHYEWHNLQADCTNQEAQALEQIGVKNWPGITSFADTAGLIMNLDVVLSVDTAVAHLSSALGRPTWVMLPWYMVDWRWLLGRDDSPWYTTAKLFRQSDMGNWTSVFEKISLHLKYFKV